MKYSPMEKKLNISNHKTPNCEDDKLMSTLASLQIIDPENIVRLALKRAIVPFCKNVSVRLVSAYDYLRHCTLMATQKMYANLIDGVESLYETLCLDENYRHAFESYSKCFKSLYSDIDNCDGPKDWVEDLNTTRLCKAYQDIVDCYMIKTAVVCGPEAADIFKKLLINVLRGTVVTDCGIRSRPRKNIEPIMTETAFEILLLIIFFFIVVVLVTYYCINKSNKSYSKPLFHKLILI